MKNLAQLRLATAIVYHMPGASMTLTGGGKEIFVAPTSEIRSDLHPGDLRDLIHLCIRNQNTKALSQGLNIDPDSELIATIKSAPPLFESLGAGLYMIIPPTTRSVYCFPTLLLPKEVENIITTVSGGTISSTLDYDEALGVTLATFERRQIGEKEPEKGGIIGQILAECAVAEEFTSKSMPA
ncbi:MAG: hypothetical protein U0R17_07330 [Acidimicrobiia bacterium]